MKNYVITCCSTVDMNEDFFLKNQISYIPFTFTINNQEYFDDYGKTYSLKQFYDEMRNGSTPTTSQISIGRYIDFFEEKLKEGRDILHLTLSSGITGTYNSACLAADVVNEKYNNKVYVVDSLAASSGYGMLVMMAKNNLDDGMSLEENLEWLSINKLRINHWFFTSDLTYLVRGGRVSKASGIIGNALHICPLLYVSNVGTLIAKEKIRGKKKVIKEMVNKMKTNADDGLRYSKDVYISCSDCLDDAKELENEIRKEFKNIKSCNIYSIGTVIGAHTGPGTVALFFIGKTRED